MVRHASNDDLGDERICSVEGVAAVLNLVGGEGSGTLFFRGLVLGIGLPRLLATKH